MFLYLKTKKILNSIHLVFMDHGTSIGNNLDVWNGRYEIDMIIEVDKYYKTPLVENNEGIEEYKE